jgi:oligoendopeptidase F
MGAFCEGHFGFFMDNYQGYLTNVSTLAHEAGHAIHHQVELNHQESLLFGEGPSYMTESFSMFNEWLLRDHLMKNEKDPELLKSYENDALYEMAYLWELARRAKFEMISYDRVAEGAIQDASGFDRVCLDVGNEYDLFFKNTPELNVHWMRKHHYWSVPTYYINYVVAHVLALTYYQHYLEDPEGFSKNLVAMQAAGFDRPAAQLLKDFLDIDMNDPAVLEGTFRLIRSRLDALRKNRQGG